MTLTMYYLKRLKKPLPNAPDQTPIVQYYIGGGDWAAVQCPKDPSNRRILLRLWENRKLAESCVREQYRDAQICETTIEM